MKVLIVTLCALMTLFGGLIAQADNLYSDPPDVELTQSDLKKLHQRQRVFKQYQLDQKTREVVIFRVAASEQKIWETILNYAAYPEWVKGVKHTHVYKSDEKNYYVEFLIGHWLLGEFAYSVHHYLSDDSWMKWKMDESKPSDFLFTNGFWKVRPAKNEANAYNVFYSADLEFKPAKSAYTTRKVIKAGLKQTSVWLRREAERLN